MYGIKLVIICHGSNASTLLTAHTAAPKRSIKVMVLKLNKQDVHP